MEGSVLLQVLPYSRLAVGYIEAKFDLAEKAAMQLVQSVLVGLQSKHSGKLKNPKRYLLRACRWKALKPIRRQTCMHGVRVDTESPEILIALEEADRERFFGSGGPQERQDSKVARGPPHLELAATVEVPGAFLRIKFGLSKPMNKAS